MVASSSTLSPAVVKSSGGCWESAMSLGVAHVMNTLSHVTSLFPLASSSQNIIIFAIYVYETQIQQKHLYSQRLNTHLHSSYLYLYLYLSISHL